MQTGNGINSPTSRPLIKKLLLQNVSHLFQGFQNWFSKQEMELSKQEMGLSKQEMELFLPLPGLWSKNFFNKMFLIWSKEFKINFQNRKWNYPNRKWNYFSHFQASDQKNSFIKCLSFNLRVSKLIQIMKWNTLKCIDFLFVDILSLSLFTSLLYSPPFSIQGHILLKRIFYT